MDSATVTGKLDEVRSSCGTSLHHFPSQLPLRALFWNPSPQSRSSRSLLKCFLDGFTSPCAPTSTRQPRGPCHTHDLCTQCLVPAPWMVSTPFSCRIILRSLQFYFCQSIQALGTHPSFKPCGHRTSTCHVHARVTTLHIVFVITMWTLLLTVVVVVWFEHRSLNSWAISAIRSNGIRVSSLQPLTSKARSKSGRASRS